MLSEVFRIPEIYTEMSRKGFFNKDTYLWLNDMEWIPIEKIGDYEYEDGESRSVVPFAFTGGGDKWVWVIDEGENDYPVGLCEGAEVNGIYYARNTRDAILRQIIDFVSGSNFYVNAEESPLDTFYLLIRATGNLILFSSSLVLQYRYYLSNYNDLNVDEEYAEF